MTPSTLTPGQRIEIRIVAGGPWYLALYSDWLYESGHKLYRFTLQQNGRTVWKTAAQLRDEVRGAR